MTRVQPPVPELRLRNGEIALYPHWTVAMRNLLIINSFFKNNYTANSESPLGSAHSIDSDSHPSPLGQKTKVMMISGVTPFQVM